MLKFILAALILSSTIATSIHAQQTIYGTVLDELGDPIYGASIKVFKDSSYLAGTATNFDGFYRINLDPGTYDLEFTYIGYMPHRIEGATLSSGQHNKLDCYFNDDEGIVLETAIVTGYRVDPMRVDETTQGQTLTAEDVRKLGTRNVTGIAALSAGATSSSKDKEATMRRARPNSKAYAIDEVSVARLHPSQQAPVANKYNEQLPVAPGEDYAGFLENTFVNPISEPLSTFGADVDVASYANMRRFLSRGQLPPKHAIRTEELVNYFKYDYAQPTNGQPVAFSTELGDCPWNKEHKLLHVGLQARELDVDKLPASNIVFLIDVSGSMSSANKLPLLKEGYRLLAKKLRPQDKVSIVVYAGAAGLVLEPTPGDQKEKILAAIDRLKSGGSTAGAAGLKLAYQTAAANFVKGGNNRIVLATDGDFNVGTTDNQSLEAYVASKRKSGIFLSVLGFGSGNYQDARMQTLAENGNGNAAYIDNLLEARKVLIEEFGSTLFTVAKDVKLQVEFNPAYVQSYRLIGYESRLLNPEDFNDDTKDAGEMGSGHTVTALYELIPVGAKSSFSPNIEPLKYQQAASSKAPVAAQNGEWATVRMKYKKPAAETSDEKVEVVVRELKQRRRQASENFRWSAAIAAWSMMLKNSTYVNDYTYDELIDLAENSTQKDEKGYRKEAVRLMKTARDLYSPELVEAVSK